MNPLLIPSANLMYELRLLMENKKIPLSLYAAIIKMDQALEKEEKYNPKKPAECSDQN